MDKKFIEKCNEIFEEKKIKKVNNEKLEKYKKLTKLKFSPELMYILENYEGVMLKEGYGFVSKQLSPFADENGYETFIAFMGVDTSYNLMDTYQMYKEQLPLGVYPIAEMDGGNYICLSENEKVYIWLHDCVEQEGIFLANVNIKQFVLSIEKIPECNVNDIDLSEVESEYSDDFWD